jgi:hypothetical protein
MNDECGMMNEDSVMRAEKRGSGFSVSYFMPRVCG